MNTELNTQLADKFEKRTGVCPIKVDHLGTKIRIKVDFTDEVRKMIEKYDECSSFRNVQVEYVGTMLPYYRNIINGKDKTRRMNYQDLGYCLYVNECDL